MPDWSSPNTGLCLVSIAVLAVSWGFLERRVKLLARGACSPGLGWEKIVPVHGVGRVRAGIGAPRSELAQASSR